MESTHTTSSSCSQTTATNTHPRHQSKTDAIIWSSLKYDVYCRGWAIWENLKPEQAFLPDTVRAMPIVYICHASAEDKISALGIMDVAKELQLEGWVQRFAHWRQHTYGRSVRAALSKAYSSHDRVQQPPVSKKGSSLLSVTNSPVSLLSIYCNAMAICLTEEW